MRAFSLLLAAKEGRLLEKLLEINPDLNSWKYEDIGGTTILHFATYYNDLKATKALLENGHNPNAYTNDGIHTLGFKELSIATIKLLLQFGANPNMQNVFGDGNALDAAFPNVEKLTLLVQCGARWSKSNVDMQRIPGFLIDLERNVRQLRQCCVAWMGCRRSRGVQTDMCRFMVKQLVLAIWACKNDDFFIVDEKG